MKLQRNQMAAIAAACLCAGIASYAAIAGILYWQMRTEAQAHLADLSQRAFIRAKSVFDEYDAAFKKLYELPSFGCKDSTLDKLRAVVKGAAYLKSASIELGQNIYCTDVGLIFREKPEPDFRSSDGTMAWLYRQNLYTNITDTLYMQRRNIVLSSLHSSFLNLISESNARILMISSDQHQVLARFPAGSNLNDDILNRLAGSNRQTMIDGVLYQSHYSQALNITVITYRRMDTYIETLNGGMAPWLPISLLISLLTGTLLYRRYEFLATPEQRLKQAVANKDFTIYYQPIVSLRDGRCIGAECLLRWQDENGHEITPNEFIPMAERVGQIEPLTDLILEKSIKDLADLLMDDRLYLSINLSAGDMAKSRFFPILTQQLQRAGLQPQRIAIEATERGFVNTDRANEVLRAMRDAGHPIFIDDFGTGYSSLSYLQKLAIDVLKIDKAFVDAIATGSATSSVIVHIIGMAKELHLKTVAEGVETEAQAEFLRIHGVDAGQGWLFSKPLSAQEFRTYLKETHNHV